MCIILSLIHFYTFLTKTYAEDGTIDLTNSIYIDWGLFLTAIIDFFIIAFCIFMAIKVVNKLSKKKEEKKEEPKPPVKSDEVLLLEEIRDLMKKENKKTTKSK